MKEIIRPRVTRSIDRSRRKTNQLMWTWNCFLRSILSAFSCVCSFVPNFSGFLRRRSNLGGGIKGPISDTRRPYSKFIKSKRFLLKKAVSALWIFNAFVVILIPSWFWRTDCLCLSLDSIQKPKAFIIFPAVSLLKSTRLKGCHGSRISSPQKPNIFQST